MVLNRGRQDKSKDKEDLATVEWVKEQIHLVTLDMSTVVVQDKADKTGGTGSIDSKETTPTATGGGLDNAGKESLVRERERYNNL